MRRTTNGEIPTIRVSAARHYPSSGMNLRARFCRTAPVFMYLTDYREYSLQDIITQVEPKLFRKVTGLEVDDSKLLCSLNVFNGAMMNDAA